MYQTNKFYLCGNKSNMADGTVSVTVRPTTSIAINVVTLVVVQTLTATVNVYL